MTAAPIRCRSYCAVRRKTRNLLFGRYQQSYLLSASVFTTVYVRVACICSDDRALSGRLEPHNLLSRRFPGYLLWPVFSSAQHLTETERSETGLLKRSFADAPCPVDACSAVPRSRPFPKNAPNPPLSASPLPACGIPRRGLSIRSRCA